MKRLFIFIFFATITFCSYGQDQINCDKILDQRPFLVKNKIAEDDPRFKRDIEILKHCGDFSSIDSAFFKSPLLGSLMLDQVRLGKPATYRTLIEMLTAFRKTSAYKDFSDGMAIYRKLKEKKINMADWETDKELFVRMGFTIHDLADFKQFLEAPENITLTYMAALSKYMMEIEALN